MTSVKYMTTTHEFDAQVSKCGDYCYDATYTVDWVLEDQGIGAYEFWGSPGVDSHMEWTPSDLWVDSIKVYEIEDGGLISNLTGDEVYLENPWIEKVEGWCCYHAERLDGPE